MNIRKEIDRKMKWKAELEIEIEQLQYKLNKVMLENLYNANKELFSINEVAIITSMTPSIVKARIKDGTLKAKASNNRYYITKENLNNLIKELSY